MGARWNWEAICERGHLYGNFSGGADECYTCGADALVVFDGDDAAIDRARYLGVDRTRGMAPDEVLSRVADRQRLDADAAEHSARAIREYEHLRSFHRCEEHPTDAVCAAVLAGMKAS